MSQDPSRVRPRVRSPWPSSILVLLALGIALVAIVGQRSTSGVGPQASPTSTPENPIQTYSGDSTTATEEGLSLTVSLSGTAVDAGAPIEAQIEVRNEGADRMLAIDDCGAPAIMFALLKLPTDQGKTWTGIAAELKEFAQSDQANDGGLPTTAARPALAVPTTCETSEESELLLQAGGGLNAVLLWRAEVIDGVPAVAQLSEFEVGVRYRDPESIPPSPKAELGAAAERFGQYERLAIQGSLQIEDQQLSVASPGQALDAALQDDRFAGWLEAQPSKSWTAVNFFLVNHGAAQGIVPAGPNWELDVFRKAGDDQASVVAFIDPLVPSLRALSTCDLPPCVRE